MSDRLLHLRGTATAAGTSSVPLPAGTQVGDVMFMQGHAGNEGGGNVLLPTGAMNDPRLTGHVRHLTADDWWGTVTDLSDVLITVPAGGTVIIATFGGSDPSVRLSLGAHTAITKAEAYGNQIDDILVPELNAQGVIICTTNDRGFVTAAPVFSPSYLMPVADDELGIQWWTGIPKSPAYTWSTDDDYQVYDRTITVIPVFVVDPSPVRQYPRDDGRGHSSARRLYPPVKAARIVGGYQ